MLNKIVCMPIMFPDMSLLYNTVKMTFNIVVKYQLLLCFVIGCEPEVRKASERERERERERGERARERDSLNGEFQHRARTTKKRLKNITEGGDEK